MNTSIFSTAAIKALVLFTLVNSTHAISVETANPNQSLFSNDKPIVIDSYGTGDSTRKCNNYPRCKWKKTRS